MEVAVMGDRGWLALDENTPLARLVAAHPVGEGLPCCSFVAAWSLCVAGMVGEDIAADLSAWARLAPSYWAIANIRTVTADELDECLRDDGDDREWDSLEAALRMLGGRRSLPVVACAAQPAPALEPGRWHVVQRWKWQGLTGHTYLVKADLEGPGCVVVQSSIRHGTRIDEGTWEGAAGLSGYRVAVVTLPSFGGP
jgi:hypothetical protein